MIRRALLAALALCLLVPFIGSLSLTGPTWSPTSAFTNNTLNCSWTNSSDTLAQNITILRDGTQYNSTYENASATTLSTYTRVAAADTTKGEVWTCLIILYNETTSTQASSDITILNSPPVLRGLPAGIFNTSGTDIGDVVQVLEDVTLSLDMNATDADGDTISYALISAQFCQQPDSSTGILNCTPTNSYLTSNNVTMKNVSFAAQDPSDGVIRIVTFNITPVNDAPTLSLTNQTTPVNVSLNYTFSVSDEENSISYTFAISSDAEISDKLSISTLVANGSLASLYYNAAVPDFADVGVHNVTINVTDNATAVNGSNDSKTSSYTITLNITSVGRRPYFTSISPGSSFNISQGQTIQINISANDPDENSTIIFLDNTGYFNISTIKSDTNTSDATAQINYTALNAHVGQFSVTITIQDAESLTNTTTLQFNVTNVNDAPTIDETSTTAGNTGGNNASNLTAYANTPFVYTVNATDPDTIHGDTLTFAENTSLFAIDPSTGVISFTPDNGVVAGTPYHINVSVSDAQGLVANRTIILQINANNPPYFNQTFGQLNCTTKALCTLDLTQYAQDPDGGDSVDGYVVSIVSGGTLASLNWSNSTGLISFNVSKTEVGNYTINVTINDTFGAVNSTRFNLSINNTPEAPNLTRFNMSDQTIVETHLFTYEFQATDDDLLVASAADNVTFTTNLSLSHTITYIATSNTTVRALFSITPADGSAGNYSIRINATDRFGLVQTKVITLQVQPNVPPPNITNVTPVGFAPNFTINTTSSVSTLFPTNSVTVNASENLSIDFNVTIVDSRPLTYNWTVNGTQTSTSGNITMNFNYFSAGRYIISLNASNDLYESSRWSWTLIVQNVNRPPVLNNSLTTPLTINTTFLASDYFIGGASTSKFFDPDDDLNTNGQLDGNETNTLTFSTASSCAVAGISISGADLTLTPTGIGSCTVYFNATDTSGATLESNQITINVTNVPTGDDDQVTTTSSGGGGSSSASTLVPIARDRETPKAFDLVAPKLVTIYDNTSVIIPITINNTWNTDLDFVQIWATTNDTRMNTSFDQDLFETIPANESRNILLTVWNYRLGENYEIVVQANVSDPQYEDSALILLNSIEQSSDGDQVKVKVTFANDLLNQHPECQELNEVLDQAKSRLAQRNFDEAGRLVDSVINGCKYLVSTQQKIEESPSRINPIISIENLSLRTLMWTVLVFIVVASIALLLYYHYSYKAEEDI